jgi:signal transduction histidine kinase
VATAAVAEARGWPERLAWLAWPLFGVVLALEVIGLVFAFLSQDVRVRSDWGTGTILGLIALTLPFVCSAAVGAFLASKLPRNLIGWLFILVGLGFALTIAGAGYGVYGYLVRDPALPGAEIGPWFGLWGWILSIAIPVGFIPMLFPDGRITRARAPYFIVATVFLVASVLASMFQVYQLAEIDRPNPFALENLEVLTDIAANLFFFFIIAGVVGVVRLARRMRRAEGDERQQIKWFLVGAAIPVIGISVAGLTTGLVGTGDQAFTPFWGKVLQDVGTSMFIAMPIATGVAVLKYRLYDLDLVINKAVVFGVLAGFITAVYVAIVVGIGAAVGSGGSRFLPVAAAAIIAVAFQPVRVRAHNLANRLVFGKRATPYEVLAEFSGRMGTTYSNEDVLPRMARAVADGVGASRSEIWIRIGTALHPAAGYPEDPSLAPVELSPPGESDVGSLPGFDHVFPVRDRGELLGALAVTKPPAEPLTPAEEKLLRDLASQAGLVLRNVRLTSELRLRLDELAASRKRLVAAQDEERRRLERNIHDGAQQQLVALAVKLRLAETLVERDTEQVKSLLQELRDEATEAMDDLRDLARGIYPPLLADQGLWAALDAQARKAAMPVTLEMDGVGRYQQDVEAAVYFSCLEALQNAAKYAEADSVEIRMEEEDGHLVFTVRDNGRGFDPATTKKGAGLTNIADRLAALGGKVEVRSKPGEGTQLTGRIPVS